MSHVTGLLLQEYVEGKNLTQMLDTGWRPSHFEVQRIAAELLEILAYLHLHQFALPYRKIRKQASASP